MTGPFAPLDEYVEGVLRTELARLLDALDRSRERLAEREQEAKDEAALGVKLNERAAAIERALQEHGRPVQSRADRERDRERRAREILGRTL